MSNSLTTFYEQGKQAGFTEAQLDFLSSHLAFEGHTHEIADVLGLGGALEEAGVEPDEEDEEDEDDEDEEVDVLLPDEEEDKD